MIPSALSMEFKYGLLCSTGEDVLTHGQFPLLGSTNSLLDKLGFNLCDDLKRLKNDDDEEGGKQSSNHLGTLIHHSENKLPANSESERLTDVLMIALDDIRDLRHRLEKKDEQGEKNGKNVSRKTKRINFKVDSLEKQRAKLLEKQKQNETDDQLQDGVDGDDNNEHIAEVKDAWIRMARAFNSARLLLFLFSQEEGLDILAEYDLDSHCEDHGIRSLGKIVNKLSDVLEVLLTSSKLVGNNVSEGITRDAINKWEKIISMAILSRRDSSKEHACTSSQSDGNHNVIDLVNEDVIDLVNETVIDLVSDSSTENEDHSRAESDLYDDLSEEMMENAVDTENPPVGVPNQKSEYSISAPNEITTKSDNDCIHSRFFLWNSHLDMLMTGIVSAINTKGIGSDMKVLECAFASTSLNDATDGSSDEIAVHKRANGLDEQFSLNVGITGSKDYQTRKKYLISIERLRYRVEQKIRQGRKSHEFEDARLDVYGSCLSGLSLGKNADVDLSLTFSEGIEKKLDFEAGDLTAKKYHRHVTDTVYKIKRKLEHSRRVGPSNVDEFREIEAVPRARVPVIKGVYTDANNPHSEDGSLHFDICLLNDIAVANSGLIKEYSDVDIRVKSLMIAVKRWTKDNKINAAHDNTLSSYTWINMVIFYLQCIGFVPNLQCPALMRECKHEMGWGKSRRRQDNINNLNTAYLKWNGQVDRVWKRPKEIDEKFSSVSMLLYGFFRFYSHEFPSHMYLVSIKRGGEARIPKTVFPDRASLHICIEDPFETYDSHFPHDLGRPADEAGSMLISRCLHNSEEHLRRFLFGGDIPSVEDLWPITTLTKDSSGRSRRNRNSKAEIRDPEMTLVVASKSGNFRKDDLLKTFQKFADLTKSKIVGSSLINGGRLSYVDYDSVAAVDSALVEHAQRPLEINGKTLSVSRKSASASSRRRSKDKNTAENNTRKEPKKEEDEDRHAKENGWKGDPEKTLVVQNIFGGVYEKGIAKIFQPFAEQTKSKLITVDISKKKKIAFVDFDSSAPVLLALEEHSKNPLCWNGKALHVSQKKAPGWKKRKKAEKAQAKNNQTKQKTPKKVEKKQQQKQRSSSPSGENDANPQSEKGEKNNGRKKKQGKKNKKKNSNNKPIVNANDSIQEQI